MDPAGVAEVLFRDADGSELGSKSVDVRRWITEDSRPEGGESFGFSAVERDLNPSRRHVGPR